MSETGGFVTIFDLFSPARPRVVHICGAEGARRVFAFCARAVVNK